MINHKNDCICEECTFGLEMFNLTANANTENYPNTQSSEVEAIANQFIEKFCSLSGFPVIVKGVLRDAGHHALLEDDGDRVIDWLRTTFTQLTHSHEARMREMVEEMLKAGVVFDTKVFAIPYARERYEDLIKAITERYLPTNPETIIDTTP